MFAKMDKRGVMILRNTLATGCRAIVKMVSSVVTFSKDDFKKILEQSGCSLESQNTISILLISKVLANVTEVLIIF